MLKEAIESDEILGVLESKLKRRDAYQRAVKYTQFRCDKAERLNVYFVCEDIFGMLIKKTINRLIIRPMQWQLNK